MRSSEVAECLVGFEQKAERLAFKTSCKHHADAFFHLVGDV